MITFFFIFMFTVTIWIGIIIPILNHINFKHYRKNLSPGIKLKKTYRPVNEFAEPYETIIEIIKVGKDQVMVKRPDGNTTVEDIKFLYDFGYKII